MKVPACRVKSTCDSLSNYNNLAYLSLLTISNLMVE